MGEPAGKRGRRLSFDMPPPGPMRSIQPGPLATSVPAAWLSVRLAAFTRSFEATRPASYVSLSMENGPEQVISFERRLRVAWAIVHDARPLRALSTMPPTTRS